MDDMDPQNPLFNLTLSKGMFDYKRNCSAAGAVFAYFRTDRIPPVDMVRSYISSCSNTTVGEFTDGDAMHWYVHYAYTVPQYNGLHGEFGYILSWCEKELCQNWDFKGNADLAGIGVSTYLPLPLHTPPQRLLCDHTAVRKL